MIFERGRWGSGVGNAKDGRETEFGRGVFGSRPSIAAALGGTICADAGSEVALVEWGRWREET